LIKVNAAHSGAQAGSIAIIVLSPMVSGQPDHRSSLEFAAVHESAFDPKQIFAVRDCKATPAGYLRF